LPTAKCGAVIKEPKLRDKILKLGAVPERGSPQEVAGFLRAEAAKWKHLIETARIRTE
jgi:tripartite-type tricarboxylate transporter receptor subunit TctC